MNYYFVNDSKNKRHIIVAENEENLKEILRNSNVVSDNSYELEPDTFNEVGFLISDK